MVPKEKKMKALLFSIAMMLCISLSAQIPVAPSQGTGTINDPFQIANFGNLFWIAQTPSVWNQHFIQTNHIDAGESVLITDPTPNTAGWIPIGNGSMPFSGSYDGQGYDIYTLILHRPSQYYTGLFGYMSGASLNRINLRDVSINGQIYTGGLAAVANSGSVINNCSVTGTVSGLSNVGGLLGYCDGSGTTNSYSHASVYSTGDNVGGFVGISGWNNSSYHNFCYSTGSVNSSASYTGGFIGRTGSVSIKDCYWDIQSSGMTYDPLAIGKSTNEMKQQSTYRWWNFQNQWNLEEGISYPKLDALHLFSTPPQMTPDNLYGWGTEGEPYVLWTAADLNVMRQNPGAFYILGTDIDLSSSVVWNHGKGWEPVGSVANPFTGYFDGNGFTINGLTINRPQTDYQGLFGYTCGASIRRLNLTEAHILGKNHCGGYVAYALNSRLDELSFEGIIVAHNASGGIASVIHDGSLQRSMADVTMKNYTEYAGGLAGYLISSSSTKGTISNSGSTGLIEGNSHVAGLVGMVSWGYVLNSYSHASVSGLYQVAGLAGTVGWSNPGYISRCFATGTVTVLPGGSFSGGLIGRFMNGSILESYWDIQSTNQSSSSGMGATGKNTAEMMQQSTFERWNFDTLWQMSSVNTYPFHQNLSGYALPLELTTSDLFGMGTADEPYVIQTIDQLNVMHQAPDAYFYLNNDLDLSATCVWNGGKGWQPVGNSSSAFTGVFDGGANELSNLFIERPDGNHMGLFGYASGSYIKDIVFTGANVHGNNYIGAVTGYALDSRIDMIDMHGIVSGYEYVGGISGELNRGIIQRSKADLSNWAISNYSGGIVGHVVSDAGFNSTVSTCEVSGSVRSNSNAGGLIGFLSHGALINSSSHANVKGYYQVGGAVGTCGWNNPGAIVQCFSTGQVIQEPGASYIGGLVGRLQNGQVYDSYWDTQNSGILTGGSNDAIGLNTNAMQQQSSYKYWNFHSLWQIFEGTDYPRLRDLSQYQDPTPVTLDLLWGTGTHENPYLIQIPDHLNAIRQDLSAHYQIDADMDLSATIIWNGGRGWDPIGNTSNPFNGTIDGANHSIYSLSIMAPLKDNQGLLGSAQNATISNLKLTNLSLVGENNLGGIAGSGSNCDIDGNIVNAIIIGNSALGALFGVTSGSTVQNCSADVKINARYNYAGALIGSAQGNTQVSFCSGSGNLKGQSDIGGLVGELLHGSIFDSYSHANVNGNQNIGGAVGKIGWGTSGNLTRCYSTGNVNLNPGGYSAGGLVGSLFNGTVQQSYWDINTSGMNTSNGAGAVGLITSQMTWPQSQNHFESWDFANVWRQDSTFSQNNGYPYLTWQEAPTPDAVQNLQIASFDNQITLQWQPVTGVNLYKVYASEDPHAPLNQWILIGQTSSFSFIYNAEGKRFFIVKSAWD